MVKRARPAVVRIETNSATGSGAIYEVDGQTAYVITNHHVIEGYNRVTVTVDDRDKYQGEVLGSDSVRDLAVVEICCGSFTRLSFGDVSMLDPGDEVVNIGYPLGLSGEATITRGIVSAIRYISQYRSDVIQTDAATNPGNSGGPMLSLNGEILGINTFGIDESASGRPVEGLNFAISGKTVQARISALQGATTSLTPTPTRRSSSTPTPRPSAGGTDSFGPINGELRHDATDGKIETEYANVFMADMVVEATFINPYSSGYNSWDYGFNIRDLNLVERLAGSDAPYVQVVVTSDGRWSAQARNHDFSYSERIGGGTISNLDTSDGGKNHLRVVAIGAHGWFFVNDEFVSLIDLSDAAGSDEYAVAVITGAFTDNEVDGKVTRFENFTGTRLTKRYGPAGGRLVKEPGSIGFHNSEVWTRDLVVEAEFASPQGDEWDWDYGFIIRNPEFNRLEVIGVEWRSGWFHETHTLGDSEYTTVAVGSPAARLGYRSLLRGINHLLLMAFGDTGWFFLDNSFLAKLDLSHNLDSGWVSAMGDFFHDHQGSPEFGNFNVWAP